MCCMDVPVASLILCLSMKVFGAVAGGSNDTEQTATHRCTGLKRFDRGDLVILGKSALLCLSACGRTVLQLHPSSVYSESVYVINTWPPVKLKYMCTPSDITMQLFLRPRWALTPVCPARSHPCEEERFKTGYG